MNRLALADRPKSFSTPGAINPNGKMHALTSLRFFAALCVVLYHTIWWGIPGKYWSPFFVGLASIGYVAVPSGTLRIGLTIGVAALSFRYFETPILKVKDRLR
jgi:peptidoglycan/LPS O-acetylase OafA/YrhL